MSKFDRNENPNWEPDALVELTFTDRDIEILNGYKPTYQIVPNYLTCTAHWFIENGKALPQVATKAFVKFISQEAYPNSISTNMVLNVTEGSKIVGKSKIIEIYNETLRKDS